MRRLVLGTVCSALLGGCVSATAAVNAGRATRAVARARQAAAGEECPYEMTLAEAYLAKAREESAEAQYRDSVRFSRLSVTQAQKAVELMRERRRGAGGE